MLDIKMFPDGDRFIVVFEGLKAPERENIALKIIGALNNGDGDVAETAAEMTAPANLVPLPMENEEEIISDIPREYIFEAGPYEGVTVSNVLTGNFKEDAVALNWLVTEEFEPSVRNYIDSEIIKYFQNKFKDTDPDGYSATITDKQVGNMITKVFVYFPKSVVGNFEGYGTLTVLAERGKIEDQREFIKHALQNIKKI